MSKLVFVVVCLLCVFSLNFSLFTTTLNRKTVCFFFFFIDQIVILTDICEQNLYEKQDETVAEYLAPGDLKVFKQYPCILIWGSL